MYTKQENEDFLIRFYSFTLHWYTLQRRELGKLKPYSLSSTAWGVWTEK